MERQGKAPGAVGQDGAEEIADLLSEIGRTFKSRLRSRPDSPARHLSMPQRDVLKIIGRRPGVTPAGIGERTGRDRGQITRLVSELEALRLVQRSRSTADRRSVVLQLSDEGSTLFGRMLEARADLSRQMLADLGAHEVETLRVSLQRLRSTLRGLPSGPSSS